MITRIHRFALAALAGLALAVSSPAPAQNTNEAGKLRVSRTAPSDPDEHLRKWFSEQDKLLDELLVRLSRIEQLVRDLHQLIVRMPSATAPPAPVASPTAPAIGPSVSPPRPKPTGILGFFDTWGIELASLGLLLLVAMISLRNRREKKTAQAKAAIRKLDAAPSVPSPQAPAARAPTPPPPAQPAAPAKPAVPTATPVEARQAKAPISDNQGDQALELAEIMLSMGLGHGAAQTLVEQIRREPKQALVHWLKLLEIYRKNGQQEEFEQSAEELRLHFNIQPEDWHVQSGTQRSLEDYPHIAKRVAETWGSPDCLSYLQHLLGDNRGGARAGFPLAVAEELVLLSGVLKQHLGAA